jgi:D-3-phosphoglycerate dehydrogenase
MDPVSRPAEQALAEQGHAVTRFNSLAEFEADPEAVAGSDVIVAMPQQRIGRRHMQAAGRLRALISPVTGTEGFDQDAADELGVLIVNGQIPENNISLAEATILMMLAALFDLPGAQAQLRDSRPRPEHLRAHMIGGKTIGLVGFGQIARAVAERLAPWGVHILTWIRSTRPLPAGVHAVPLDELLRRSDVVTVLVALTDETRHLLDAERLALMKPDVVLVNMARGPIVDEAALAALAAERPQMRLALDVFETEPLPKESPLRRLPGAILTPHIVGHTVEAHDLLPRRIVRSVEDVLRGHVPDTTCNPDTVAAWRRRFGH